jgi:hypothetical protein
MTSGKLIARFDDLSVRHKILAGYAALIMPFLALVVVAGAMSARILTLSHQINNDSIPLLEALQSARHLGIAAIEATNTFALISALGPDAAATPTADGSDRQAELVTAREAFCAVLDYLAMRASTAATTSPSSTTSSSPTTTSSAKAIESHVSRRSMPRPRS